MTSYKRFSALFLLLAVSGGSAAAFEFPSIFGAGGNVQPAPEDAPTGAPRGKLVSCPEILIDGGEAALRSPPNADAANVRYQLSLGHMARECALDGDHISIKVGVEGAVVLGPLGQPGSYSGNLRVALRRTKDETIVSSKSYRVGATVPGGATRGEFSVVADPISAPFVSPHAAGDYDVLVGFTSGGGETPDKPARTRKKKRRGHG